MNWHEFHHPDISWPVIRRQAGLEIIELLELSSRLLIKGGWAEVNRNTYPSQAAYRTAICRLGKQGLVINKGSGTDMPKLILTDAGKQHLPAFFYPEKYWNRSWNKIWYMMIYDVPEKDRKYRNVLRQFLKRKRMGCLQKSVWVTPEDIRPDFHDLSKAANIEAYAYLFESKTVLGLPPDQIVNSAWNFDRLEQIQSRFCIIMERNLSQLSEERASPAEMLHLIKMAINGFHAAMIEDPLLPWPLYPEGYLGKKVLSLHQKLLQEVDRQSANYR